MQSVLLAEHSVLTKHLVNIHCLTVGTHASYILPSVFVPSVYVYRVSSTMVSVSKNGEPVQKRQSIIEEASSGTKLLIVHTFELNYLLYVLLR
jgi:hypothetical protein